MFSRDRFHKFLAAATAGVNGPASERGISLAEVSGVLVISALIIAGALKGGELITISQLRAGIAEVEKVQSATSTFQEQNLALPGDFPAANARIGDRIRITWVRCGGIDRTQVPDEECDGDGVIEGDGTTLETVLFWQHLAASNLITGIEIDEDPFGLDSTSTSKLIFGVSLPANPIGGGLTVVQDDPNDNLSHWLRLGTAEGDDDAEGVIDADLAKAIDKKIDDGRPATGTVQVDVFEDAQCVTTDGRTEVYETVVDDVAAVDCLLYFKLSA